MNSVSESLSFWEHLEDLRSTLIKILWVVLIGTSIAFVFHQPVIQFLTYPLENSLSLHQTNVEVHEVKVFRTVNKGKDPIIFDLPEGGLIKNLSTGVHPVEGNQFNLSQSSYVEWEQNRPTQHLYILGPLEGFSTSLKVSLWLGIAGTSPLWLYFVFQFIAPALHQKEKYLIRPFLSLSLIFIALGTCFAYKITLPLANSYFYAFNGNLGQNLWSLQTYVNYSFLLLVSNAIAFELFVIVVLLIHYEYLSARKMKEKRKHAVVCSFILAALLTPPDVLSQVMMAIPLIILYELSIFYACFRARRSMKRISGLHSHAH